MYLICVGLLLTTLIGNVTAQENKNAQENKFGYVSRVEGEWIDSDTHAAITAGTIFKPSARFRPSAPKASIEMRFYPDLCAKSINCDPEGKPCLKEYAAEVLQKEAQQACNTNGGWAKSLSAAFARFIAGADNEKVALAMTLSRDSGANAGASEPVLTDAVLLVEDGRLDPKPLLASTASGSFSLEFCPQADDLSFECAAEADRIALNQAQGGFGSIPFSRRLGLYHVRLWTLTPRGVQASDQGATVLVGDKGQHAGTQRRFEEIKRGASDAAKTDPMIRLMMSAWLAQHQAGGAEWVGIGPSSANGTLTSASSFSSYLPGS